MASTDTAATPPKRGLSTLVLRNALVLVIAQVAVIPLALAMNFVMGRYLGPAKFGAFYLVSTYVGTAFLLIEWGQAGTLPAMIAKQRERAAVILGSALAAFRRNVNAFRRIHRAAAGAGHLRRQPGWGCCCCHKPSLGADKFSIAYHS